MAGRVHWPTVAVAAFCSAIASFIVFAFMKPEPRTTFIDDSMPQTVHVSDSQELVAPALQKTIPSCDFEKTPLPQVIQWLSDQVGMPIVLRSNQLAGLDDNPNVPVTVHLHNVSAAAVLDVVLSQISDSDVIYWQENGIIKIGTRVGREDGTFVTRIYDVRSLLQRVAPQLNQRDAADELIVLICRTINAESWVGNTSAYATIWGAL